jgi:type I restriction enzyme S subunit
LAEGLGEGPVEQRLPSPAGRRERDEGSVEELDRLFPDSFQDSPLGEIPRGWCVAELGDICKITDCLHSKKPERRDHGKPLLQLCNIRDNGLLDLSDTFWISDEDYALWTSRIEANPGDCVITNVGRVGAVSQIPLGVKAALGRNMTAIRPMASHPFPTFLIECLLSSAMRSEIELKIDSGTILDSLNVRNIPRLRLVLPTTNVIERFELLCRPFRHRMEANQVESRNLAALRDALLPKLISGEIRVKDAENFVRRNAV